MFLITTLMNIIKLRFNLLNVETNLKSKAQAQEMQKHKYKFHLWSTHFIPLDRDKLFSFSSLFALRGSDRGRASTEFPYGSLKQDCRDNASQRCPVDTKIGIQVGSG